MDLPPFPPHLVQLMMVGFKLGRAARPFPKPDSEDYVDARNYLDFAEESADNIPHQKNGRPHSINEAADGRCLPVAEAACDIGYPEPPPQPVQQPSCEALLGEAVQLYRRSRKEHEDALVRIVELESEVRALRQAVKAEHELKDSYFRSSQDLKLALQECKAELRKAINMNDQLMDCNESLRSEVECERKARKEVVQNLVRQNQELRTELEAERAELIARAPTQAHADAIAKPPKRQAPSARGLAGAAVVAAPGPQLAFTGLPLPRPAESPAVDWDGLQKAFRAACDRVYIPHTARLGLWPGIAGHVKAGRADRLFGWVDRELKALGVTIHGRGEFWGELRRFLPGEQNPEAPPSRKLSNWTKAKLHVMLQEAVRKHVLCGCLQPQRLPEMRRYAAYELISILAGLDLLERQSPCSALTTGCERP